MILIGLVGVAATLGVWLMHGQNIYSKDKIQTIVKTKNEIFGTEEEHIEWRDGFLLGLDYAVPVAGVCLLVAGVGAWKLRRERAVQA